jgi:transglutaminase-like putative cysteine protease
MPRTTVVMVVLGTLLCACASPTAGPTAAPAAHEVAVLPTGTPLPSSIAVPFPTSTVSPVGEGCVRATTEIPEGQNPSRFVTSGPASGCYDSAGDFLDDIGLTWGEFVPGIVVAFWTQWPVDPQGAVVYPTPTNTPIPASPTPTPDPWVRYRIRYWITLTGLAGRSKVWMPLPRDWNTQRDITILSLEPEPTDVFVEPLNGNRIVFWEADLEQGQTYTFAEELEISVLGTKWHIDEDNIGAYNVSDPAVGTYMAPTEFIQSNHPEVQQAANGIVGQEANPYRKAWLIFDFVVAHMKGSSPDDDALTALRTGRGECGAHAHLFVALCRAAGVPARAVTGLAGFRQGKWLWPEGVGTHIWAEFYLQDYGWIPVDTTGDTPCFGMSLANRLILSKGSDIDLAHGSPEDRIPWFHMPHVNDVQEESQELGLSVTILP